MSDLKMPVDLPCLEDDLDRMLVEVVRALSRSWPSQSHRGGQDFLLGTRSAGRCGSSAGSSRGETRRPKSIEQR